MRKNIMTRYSLLIGLVVAMGTASCSSDFTGLDPLGSTSYENYWKSEQDAIEAANAMYEVMSYEETFGRGFFWFINASDDTVTGRANASPDNIKNFNMTGDERYVNNIYRDFYVGIRRANDVILNVPKMNIREELKSRILGEAYFMRGFFYFWLAHTYGDTKTGGVPIVTEENMEAPAGSYKRPASVIDNYAHIIEDFKKAEELLPLFTTYSASDYGRAHKDAVWGYMTKTYLYWSQYDASKYQEVIKYADAVTNSGSGRSLINTGNPAKDYRELHSHLNNWTSEYIWSVNSGLDGGSILSGVVLENKGWGDYNGWGYFMPTLDLYEAFEPGDVRRDISILAFGDLFSYFGEERKYQSENSPSGFQFNKYMYEFGSADALGKLVNLNGNKPSTKYNIPLMRYAEVLLMKAEAQIQTGQSGDEALNAVRVRAGLKPINNATMKDLKQERRSEFAGEFANRHFDLVRWGDANVVYSKPLRGRIHKDRANPTSSFEVKEIWPARSFDASYMHVWPIPTTSIQSSGIDQNAGW